MGKKVKKTSWIKYFQNKDSRAKFGEKGGKIQRNQSLIQLKALFA